MKFKGKLTFDEIQWDLDNTMDSQPFPWNWKDENTLVDKNDCIIIDGDTYGAPALHLINNAPEYIRFLLEEVRKWKKVADKEQLLRSESVKQADQYERDIEYLREQIRHLDVQRECVIDECAKWRDIALTKYPYSSYYSIVNIVKELAEEKKKLREDRDVMKNNDKTLENYKFTTKTNPARIAVKLYVPNGNGFYCEGCREIIKGMFDKCKCNEVKSN